MIYRFYCLVLGLCLLGSCQETDQKAKNRVSMMQSIVDTELKGTFVMDKKITAHGTSQHTLDTFVQLASEFSLWLKYIPSNDQLIEDFESNKEHKELGVEYVYIPKESKKHLKSLIVCKDLDDQIIWLTAHIQEKQDLYYSEYHLRWNIQENEYSVQAKEGIAHSRELAYSILGKYRLLSKQ